MKTKIILFLVAGICLVGPISGQNVEKYTIYIDSARGAIFKKNYKMSFDYYVKAFAEKAPQNPVHIYEAAVVAARSSEADLAFVFLNLAIDKGYSHYNHVSNNQDFCLIDSRLFDSCLEKIRIKDSILASLSVRLDSIFDVDQMVRERFVNAQKDSEESENIRLEMIKSDSSNLSIIEDLIFKYGIWGNSLSSSKSRNTMWLVIQHAPVDVQAKYIRMMELAVERGELPPVHMAMLIDRVSLKKSGFQKYGTQYKLENGKPVIYPLILPEQVDLFRQSVGLDSLENFIKSIR